MNGLIKLLIMYTEDTNNNPVSSASDRAFQKPGFIDSNTIANSLGMKEKMNTMVITVNIIEIRELETVDFDDGTFFKEDMTLA